MAFRIAKQESQLLLHRLSKEHGKEPKEKGSRTLSVSSTCCCEKLLHKIGTTFAYFIAFKDESQGEEFGLAVTRARTSVALIKCHTLC